MPQLRPICSRPRLRYRIVRRNHGRGLQYRPETAAREGQVGRGRKSVHPTGATERQTGGNRVPESKYLPQEIDFTDFLRTQLQGLVGFKSLTHELLQNADDARAERVEFDFRADALVVANSSQFTDCGRLGETRCPLVADEQGSACDFHRMRRTAGGGKRRQEDTIGAFGVGFLSVYYVTDEPGVSSGDHRWVFRPLSEANRRIEDIALSDPEPRTVIRLPWATDPSSALRAELSLQAITEDDVRSFASELIQALPGALVFLPHVHHVTVLQDGQPYYEVEKLLASDGSRTRVTIRGDQATECWSLYSGDFAEQAECLRAKYGSLVDQTKRSVVQIAVPDEASAVDGLLYAYLPTESSTGFGFHINADFYPDPDRKRVLLTGDYRCDWNLAALQCAARVVAAHLGDIGHQLGHKRLFGVVESIYSKQDAPWGVFWTDVKQCASEAASVYCRDGQWRRPSEALWLQRSEEETAAPALEQTGLSIVHPDLRPFRNAIVGLGVKELTAATLCRQLRETIDADVALDRAPSFLADRGLRDQIYDELNRLLQRVQSPQRPTIADLPIIVSERGQVLRVQDARVVDDETRGVFGFIPQDLGFADFAGRDTSECLIYRAIPRFSPTDALDALEHALEADPDLVLDHWAAGTAFLDGLHGWFAAQATHLVGDGVQKRRYLGMPLFLAHERLRPLTELSLPVKDFDDPLRLDAVAETSDLSDAVVEFWAGLGVPRLDLPTYITRHLGPHFQASEMPGEEIMDPLVERLAEGLGKYQDNPEATETLGCLPLCLCTDGVWRAPRDVYMPHPKTREVLGDRYHYLQVPEEGLRQSRQTFLRAVGVADMPRPEDVVARVQRVVSSTPGSGRVAAVRRVYDYLADTWPQFPDDELRALGPLREAAWLPALDDDSAWHRPTDLYVQAMRHLFSSQAAFLRFARVGERAMLDFLGLRVEPNVEQVVKHLRWSSHEGQGVHPEVYRFLQRQLDGDTRWLAGLRDFPCIDVGGGRYEKPSGLFWNDHPFGRWRSKLHANYREFNKLFSELQVREAPAVCDYVDVLMEISEQFAPASQPLTDDAIQVTRACYVGLSRSIQDDVSVATGLGQVRRHKVVLSPVANVLYVPTVVYLDDKLDYKKRFHGRLDDVVIPMERDTHLALEAMGVRRVSTCVRRELVSSGTAQLDEELTARLRDRKPCIDRIVERQREDRPGDWRPEIVGDLTVHSLASLEERLSMPDLRVTSQPVATGAFLDESDKRLYVAHSDAARQLYTAMAREIAHGLNPEIDACNLVSQIRDVLEAESLDAASNDLDQMGYDRIVEGEAPVAPPTQVIDTLGTEGSQLVDLTDDFASLSSSQEGGEGEEPTTGSTPTTPTQTEPGEALDSRGAQSHTSTGGARKTSRETDGPRGTANAEAGRGADHRDTTDQEAAFRDHEPGPKGAPPDQRLRSYVEPAADDGERDVPDHDDLEQARLRAIEERGLDAAEAWVNEPGNVSILLERDVAVTAVKRMARNNPGYDLEVHVRPGVKLGPALYVEVKAIGGAWSGYGVGLTREEFEAARKHGAYYILVVVENVGGEEPPALHAIKDPASLVAEYRFDDKWREVSLAGDTG